MHFLGMSGSNMFSPTKESLLRRAPSKSLDSQNYYPLLYVLKKKYLFIYPTKGPCLSQKSTVEKSGNKGTLELKVIKKVKKKKTYKFDKLPKRGGDIYESALNKSRPGAN